MKYSFILLFLFSALSLNGQSYWAEAYGSPTNEEILDIAQTSDNGTIGVGYFSGSITLGDDDLNTTGNSDILITKFNADGSVEWAVSAGGVNADRAYAVAVDSDDNIYVTGYFINSANFGLLTASGIDRTAFICKLDEDGNFLWVNVAGGEFGDTGYGVTTDDFGNVIFGGQFRGNGVFGPDSYTSTINPLFGAPSHDLFISKLNATTGNYIWTKTAIANRDDRLLGVTVDEDGNIYACGEFSDTITFDIMHPNTAMNVGYVVKLAPDGSEIWFDSFRATQTILYDIKWKEEQIYVTGDFQGNMLITHTAGSTSFISEDEYAVFVSNLDENGGLGWFSAKHSANEVTSKQIVTDDDDNLYISGLFKCTFTELSEEYGVSNFISAGFRDVFLMKFNSAGEYELARQYGGERDDYCSGIVINDANQPLIAGSFMGEFNVPRGDSFIGDIEELAGSMYSNCGDDYYGAFSQHNTEGGKDIFIANPFDPTRQPYDFYAQVGPCTKDTTISCIMDCSDTLIICEEDSIRVLHYQNDFGPIYNYNWSTGSDFRSTYITSTGSYFVDFERQDGCVGYTDTVFVIYEVPEPPLISDAWGYNDHELSTTMIDTCGIDTLCLFGHPGDSTTTMLEWSYIPVSDDSTICVAESDKYVLTAYNIYGCTADNFIDVILDTFALHDTLDPHINFVDPFLNSTDSILVCENEMIDAFLLDSNFIDPLGGFPNKYSHWFVDGVYQDSLRYFPADNDLFSFSVSDTGWHEISAILFNECGDSVEYPVSRMIHVSIIPKPHLALAGPSPYLCPGDTITLVAEHFTDSVSWFGSIYEEFTDSVHIIVGTDSVWVNALIDTVVDGKICTNFQRYNVLPYPIPQVYMEPEHGIICPGDSLLLTTPVGIEWEWIGPYGDVLGTDDYQYVDLPGFYHALVTMEPGCVLTSTFVEAKEYSSPFLVVDEPVLCVDGIATVEVYAPSVATIEWLPPLSGSEPIMNIDSAGIYYVETSFCDITVLDSIVIEDGDVISEISVLGDTIICPDETTTLVGNSGMSGYSWAPSGASGMEYTTSDSGWYVLTVTDEYGCYGVSDTTYIAHYPIPGNPSVSDTTICYEGDVLFLSSSTDSVYWYDLDGGIIGTENELELEEITTPTAVLIQTKDSLCFSEMDTVYIGIHDGSVPPTFVGDTLICEGDDVIYFIDSLNEDLTYVWTLPDGSTIESDFLIIPFMDPSWEGEIGLSVSDDYCVSETTYLEIEMLENPEIEAFASDTLICPEEVVNLWYETDSDSSFWLSGLGSDTISTTETGTFYVIAYNGHCASYDSIAVYPRLIIEAPSSIDTLLCEGDDLLVTIPTSDNVVWINALGDTIYLDNPYELEAPMASDSVFFYLVNDDMCSSDTAQLSFTVMSTETPIITGPMNICIGDSVTLCTTMDLGSFEVYYGWYLADTLYSEEECITLLDSTENTYVFNVVIYSEYCTSDTATHELNFQSYPTFYLPEDTTLCYGETYEFSWDGDWEIETLVSEYGDTSFIYTVYNEYGCATSDTVLVDYTLCGTFLPNIFTPDGDGINDYLTFDVDKGHLVNLVILNRWGVEMYSGPYIDWDGRDKNGDECVDGEYFFVLEYRDFDEKILRTEGSFMLIR